MTRREWFGLQAGAAGLPLISVRDHGATGDGARLESPAIQRAIDAASERGGGTVYIPSGRYLCGTLRLKSNLSLWLDNGAALVMSDKDSDFDAREKLPYDPKADRATSFFRFALLWGEDLHDVAVHGEGVIDGNRTRSGGPKPISFKRCRNVSLRGITMANAGNYNISLLGCDYVVIDGVTIRNGYSDGIDPDCCRYVRIANCFVESVDDAIVLKASPALGERRSTEHVTVTNCVLRTASVFLKCGTESFGDFRNVAFSNCTLIGGMGNRHGNPGIALYTVDGGALEGFTVSNITMQNVGIPIAVRRGARGTGQAHPEPGPLREIVFSGIVATGARRTSVICGLPDAPVEDVSFADVRITVTQAMEPPAEPLAIPEKPAAYPDPTMFGPLPAFGLYARHVDGLSLRNIDLRTTVEDKRPAFMADDVRSLGGAGIRTGAAAGVAPVWFHNVRRGAWLDYDSGDGEVYARVSGLRCERIVFRAAMPSKGGRVRAESDVPAGAVIEAS